MPTPATMNAGGTAGGTTQATQGRGAPANAMPTTPFVRASQLHRESAGVDVSRAMTTSLQDLGAFPIPAYGFLRSLVLLVTTTTGAGTGVTLAADGPFNALQNILLQEPNGATIVQFNSGYDLFLAQKYGGYRYSNDARSSPAYSVNIGSGMNFSFLLRIPLEINVRDALAALPNQNAAATFQLRLSLAAVGTVFAGTLTTPPTVRIRVFAEEWDQPELSSEGAQNQTTPPAMNTTQFWSVQQFAVNAGSLNVRLTRMGNYLRMLIFLFRDGSGVRPVGANAFVPGSTTVQAGPGATQYWPNPITLYWDTRPQDLIETYNLAQQIYERYGYGGQFGTIGATAAPALDSPGGLDSGVFPYDFAHEFKGQVGFELRDLWLPTLGSTRLEIGGTWGAAGTLYVLTNDVAVAGNVFL